MTTAQDGSGALRAALAGAGFPVPEEASAEEVAAAAAERIALMAAALEEASARAPFTPGEIRTMSREHEEAVAVLEAGPAGDVRALLAELRGHLDENLETEGEFESEGSVYERGLVARIDAVLALGAREGEPVTLTYRNWRGEVSDRTVTPRGLWHGATEWHPEPQWLLSAFDHGKKEMRDFALADFLGSPSRHGS